MMVTAKGVATASRLAQLVERVTSIYVVRNDEVSRSSRLMGMLLLSFGLRKCSTMLLLWRNRQRTSWDNVLIDPAIHSSRT